MRGGLPRLGLSTVVSRGLLFGAGFLSSVVVARNLGPDGRGLAFLAVTFVVFARLPAVALDAAQLRLWQAHGSSLRWVALRLGPLVGTGSLLVVMAFGAAFHALGGIDLKPMVLLLCAVWIPLETYLGLLCGILNMDGRLRLANRALLVGEVCRMSVIVVLAATGELTLPRLVATFGLAVIVPFIIVWRTLRADGPSPPAPPGLVAETARLARRFLPSRVLTILARRVDVPLVAAFASEQDLGIYAVAVSVAEIPWLVIDAAAIAVLGRQAGFDRPDSAVLVARASRACVVIAGLLATLIALASLALVPIVFGPGFADARLVIVVLTPAAVAAAIWRTLDIALSRFADPQELDRIASGAVVANAMLNLALIPTIGIVGAAVASVVSYTLAAALSWRLLVRVGDATALGGIVPRAEDLRELLAGARSAFNFRDVSDRYGRGSDESR